MVQDTSVIGIQHSLLTESEAAEILGVSKQFLRESRMHGIRPAKGDAPPWIRVGSRSIRYDPADLQQFIDARRTHPKALPDTEA